MARLEPPQPLRPCDRAGRNAARWLDQAGALHARIEGAGGADPEEWVWRPAPPPAP